MAYPSKPLTAPQIRGLRRSRRRSARQAATAMEGYGVSAEILSLFPCLQTGIVKLSEMDLCRERGQQRRRQPLPQHGHS